MNDSKSSFGSSGFAEPSAGFSSPAADPAPAAAADPAPAAAADPAPAAAADPAPAAAADPAPAAAAPSGQSDPKPGDPVTEEYFDHRIAKAQGKVEEARSNLRLAQEALADAVADHDAELVEKSRHFPAPTAESSIRAHIARESQRRAARADAANAVNKSVGAKVVSLKSPLDTAIGGRRKPQPMIQSPQPRA